MTRERNVIRRLSFIVAIFSVLLLPLAIEFIPGKLLSPREYSVLLAPPLEEAFKGAWVWLLMMAILTKLEDRQAGRGDWVLAGVGIGVTFAILEDFPHLVPILLSLATHPIWTGALADAIYLNQANQTQELTYLLPIYLMVTVAHMSWNAAVYTQSHLLIITIIFTTGAVIWNVLR